MPTEMVLSGICSESDFDTLVVHRTDIAHLTCISGGNHCRLLIKEILSILIEEIDSHRQSTLPETCIDTDIFLNRGFPLEVTVSGCCKSQTVLTAVVDTAGSKSLISIGSDSALITCCTYTGTEFQ